MNYWLSKVMAPRLLSHEVEAQSADVKGPQLRQAN